MRRFVVCSAWAWLFAWQLLAAGRVMAVEEIPYVAGSFQELPPIQVTGDDWPWWRGPNLDGIAAEQNVPLTFGSNSESIKPRSTKPDNPPENILWKVPVPGRGLASPITWGKQLFLAAADEKTQQQWLLAYDRATGQQLWQTEIHQGGFMKDSHRKTTHAAATPACDGERIMTAFIHAGSLWVSATSLEGKILWQTEAGAYDALYGFGSAPVIYKSLVIVLGDNDRPGSFLAAIHRETGKIIWRIKRPDIDTYATPLVAHLAGQDQLLLGGSGYLWSYNPQTGQLLWKCTGPTAETTANSVAFATTGKLKDTVFVSGGYPKPYALMAVRANGSGDVSATHTLWSVDKQMLYVPSPLYADGYVYIQNDGGVASCLDAATGKSLWTKRLTGDFSASPVQCGQRIYIASEDGAVYVYKTGPKFEQLAKNDLGEGILATPTICGQRLYIRTTGHIFCIGSR